MIRNKKDMRSETKHNLRDGKGSLEFTHVLEQGDIHTKNRLTAVIRIPPGCSIGTHEHQKEEEIFYVLKGVGTITENGTVSEIGAGDVAVTQSGGSHSIENRGETELEILAVILLYQGA
jgi:mannose-6-phosphate isomerase-like protein (cupin superfamily)